MYTTEEFRTRIYAWYHEVGITVGDPEEGVWEDAHIVPRCVGGTETTPLLHGHHMLHDILQSREYDRRCFWTADVKAWLYGEGFLCEYWFDLVEIYSQYAGNTSEVAYQAWETRRSRGTDSRGGNPESARRAWETRRAAGTVSASALKGWETRLARGTVPNSEQAFKAWETRRRKAALRSLGPDQYGAMWAEDAL